MKKIVMTLVCMLLSISIGSSAFATTIEADRLYYQPNRLSKQRYQTEQTILLQQDALSACALFDKNLPVDENGQIIYPDSYAGRYIDDNGHLIIQVASSDFTPYEYLKDTYPIVELNKVEYSKSFLDNIFEEYKKTCSENEEDYFSAYVDIKTNRVVVEVDDETLSRKSEIKSNLPIVYKVGAPMMATSKTIHSGDKLLNKKSNSLSDINKQVYFSAGTSVTYGGKQAFVTCGHTMEVGDKIYSGLTRVGTVAFARFANNSMGDFGIVTMEGNHTADAHFTLKGTQYANNGAMNQVEIGQVVEKDTENSGYASFEVTATNVSECIGGSDEGNVVVNNMTKAVITEGTVQSGDSGTGIFSQFANDEKYYFCGVLSGYGEKTGKIVFTPVWIITLECSLVTD